MTESRCLKSSNFECITSKPDNLNSIQSKPDTLPSPDHSAATPPLHPVA